MKITVKRTGPADFIFIPLCILCALAALHFFWQDLNLTLQRQNEKPIGTVTWKRKAAQRRFPNRSLWDRLRKESPVYSGDFIRTAELSSATVSFFGEEGSLEDVWDSVLEINENTLIQIIRTGYGMDIELDSGGVSADVRGGDFRIRSGATVIEAGAGTSLDAINTSGGFDLQVTGGSASVLEGGERQTISRGEFIRRSSSGAMAQVIMQGLKSDMKILNNAGSGFTIPFTWTSLGLASNEQVIIEIARDRQFKRIVQSIKSSGSGNENIALDSGVYYWRAYPESQAVASAASGKIEVVAAPVPHLLRPAEGEVFNFSGERSGVRLSWNAGAEAGAYLVEVAQDPGLAGARTVEVQSTGSENGSVVLTGFSPGKWYWRVTPLYPGVYQGSGKQSAPASFTVQQAAGIAAPIIQSMPEKLYLGEDKKSYFAWKQEAGTAGYTFLLSRQRDLSNPIIEEQVNNNYYSLDPVKIKLSPGDYYWGVYQIGAAANKSPVSAAQSLVVAAGSAPTIAEGGAASRTAGTAAGAGSTPDAAGTEAAATAPLPAPRSLQPATGSVITEDLLYRDRKLSFTWNPVPDATGYVFRLYHAGRLVLTRELTEPAFTLTQLSLLDAGNFTWQVESRGNRNGEIAENRFTVRVGTAEVQVEEGGIMFGNE
jgi:hypothetical protein